MSKSIHNLIRGKFEGRNMARLLFVLSEVGHAWVNLFVERLENTRLGGWRHARMRQPLGYYAGHALAVVAAVIVLAFAGAIVRFCLLLVLTLYFPFLSLPFM